MRPPSAPVGSPSPFARAAQRLLLRARHPALRSLVQLVYRASAYLASSYAVRGERDASVYVRGSLGTAEFVPGLSDVDLAFVLGSPAGAARTRTRWRRLGRLRLPLLLLDWPRVYDEAALRDLAGASAFTWGLGTTARSVHADEDVDAIRMLDRPGLQGATADWRLVRGRDRRPREPERDAQARRAAAWLELVYWWRLAFLACVDPTLPRAADLCVKIVAEPARILLWLENGERLETRGDALRRALDVLPEEEAAFQLALELQRTLPDSPRPPLAELFAAAVRLSRRIAGVIAAQVEESGTTDVHLVGAPQEGALPLADWRGIVCPSGPDESFETLAGDPGDPVAIAAAATDLASGTYPMLAVDGLAVLPGVALPRTRLRAVECPVTDPVPFALRAGAETAAFPNVAGWSAHDTARRAVAEHRALLSRPDRAEERGTLLTAARAGLFLESVVEGDPELCVTPVEAARRLGPHDGDAELRRLVLGLAAYQAGDPLHH